MVKLKNLHDLYIAELKDLYSAETQLLKALPKMAKSASHQSLRGALEEHADLTRSQRERVGNLLRGMEVSPRGRRCHAMEGLIAEGEDLMDFKADAAVHDAAIIAAAQRMEHYEIAVYGTARTYADILGYSEAANILQGILDEESETDEKLTQIAETEVNQEALAGVHGGGE